MTYYFYHDDQLFKEAFMNYYFKNMSQKISISFDHKVKAGEIVICEKSLSDQFLDYKCLYLSNRNLLNKSEINKYQEMKVFYEMLLKNEVDEVETTEIEVYMVSNASGGAGATTISLNLAKLLAESYQVFYISLDTMATYENLLSQNQRYGFSEIVYKLKTETPFDWIPEENLEYFNVCDYVEDMMCFNSEMLVVLLDKIKSLNYERIVIDIGQRYDYLYLEDMKHYIVLDENLKNFNQITGLNRLKKPEYYLVNKKYNNKINIEHQINYLENHAQIPMDNNLKLGGSEWKSQEIQKVWKKILNLR